jgi:multiple sugar transport system permease protein
MYLNFGYAAALAWVLFLIVMMLTLMVFRSSPLWVFYERDRQGRP